MNNNDFRRLRQEAGLNEADYAKLLGYTGNGKNRVNTIKEFESGKKQIPLYIARLAWLIGEWRAEQLDQGFRDGAAMPRFPEWGGYNFEREEI